MEIIFFGTPEYVNPVFEYLFKNESLICVVTRSNKPSGRHLHNVVSPIKKSAIEKEIPVLTPEKLKDKNFISGLSAFNPQLAIVAAYGKIIPKEIIDIFPKGCINLHFSLLPKYRGAAPIQWSIIRGEKETGVTSFFLDEGLDTGKIIFQKKIALDNNDDTEVLRKKLIPVTIDVLKETIVMVKDGCQGEIQQGEATFAPILKKEDGRINWGKPVFEVHNLVRGTKPWPSAYTETRLTGPVGQVKNQSASRRIKIENLKIIESEVFPSRSLTLSLSHSLPAGSIVAIEKNIGFIVKCGKGFLLVKSVQPASKNVMSAWAYLLGHNIKIGDKLG
ncbi:MAG: methionyl-tRNA formyltransferase [Elusimicrobia bacterium]|nr:methionyl-tRNA formyltransferase [Elusimicrobiota bacterium]